MQTALPDALARLSRDHVTFRKLLNILDRQIASVAQYRAPDFDLLDGALLYFTEYSGRFHHPIEHLIYTALKGRLPNVVEGINSIEMQHGQIALEISNFAKAVENVRSSMEVSRNAFCNAARKFVAFERRHIRDEETWLFYLAISKLSAADWLFIDQKARVILEPLSDEGLSQHFAKICADLTTWDFESSRSVPTVI